MSTTTESKDRKKLEIFGTASAVAGTEGPVVDTLLTGGSGGSTIAFTSNGGEGGSTRGCTSCGTRPRSVPTSGGKIEYPLLSVLTGRHGHAAVTKTIKKKKKL